MLDQPQKILPPLDPLLLWRCVDDAVWREAGRNRPRPRVAAAPRVASMAPQAAPRQVARKVLEPA
jgi:hypothetical protein